MNPNSNLRMKTPAKLRQLLVLLLLVITVTPLAHAQSATKLPFDPDVRTGKLPNGMTYYIRKNAEPANRAEFRLAVNAGSVLENDAQQGLAHFCEHMAFNGTAHFKKSELVDALEGMGVKFGPHLNAYTSFDETVYMLQVPTDKQELTDKALLVLEDWAQALSFDNTEIDKERGVVLEEWRLRSGAMTRIIQETMPVITNGSQYAKRLPIGLPDVLKNFKYDVLKDFYKKWYRPDLMAVVAVGDFDLDKMTEQIKTRFGAVPAKPNAGERPLFPVPDHEDTRIKVVNDPESQFTLLQIMFKHDNVPYQTDADFRNDLVSQLGAAMLTGRLDELKQTGQLSTLFNIVYDGGIQGIRAKSAMNIMGILNAEGAKKGTEIILTEIERARRHGFISTEFERQKAKMVKDAENQFNERQKTPSDQLAMQYVDCFLEAEPTVGPAKNLDLIKSFLPGITLDEVNAKFKSLLQQRNAVVVLAGAEKEGAKFPTEAEIQAKITALSSENVEAYKELVDDRPLIPTQPVAGKVASETKDAKWGITEWKLSNGAKVILKPTKFKDDELIMEAFSLGGTSKFSDADYNKSWACAQLIGQSGVGQFKESVLQKKLADKSVQIFPYVNDYEEGISAYSSVKDAETMLQLFYLYFTAPRQDSEAFAAFKETMKGMVGFSNGPEGQFRDSVAVTMAQHHLRRRPLTEARVNALDLQKSVMNYKDRFLEASDFTFVLVGNFDPEQIKPWVEKYIGGLPGMNRKEKYKDLGIEAPAGITKKVVKAGTDPKSMVSISIPGPLEYSEQNIYEMNAMLSVLRIMLRENMREEKGGVYGVGANARAASYPRQGYRVDINFGCAPERVDELIGAVWTEVKKLKAEGASEKNLLKVQEIDRRSRETDLQNNEWWQQTIRHMQLDGIPMSDLDKYNSWVDGLTGAKIAELAKKYLNEEHYIQVVLYPEK